MILKYLFSRVLYNNNNLIEHTYSFPVIQQKDEPINIAIRRTLLELSELETLGLYDNQ